MALVLLERACRDRLTHLVIVALFFSWLGDWLGDLLVPHILYKIIFFFVGHVFFILAFFPYRRTSLLSRPLPLVGYLVIIATLLTWIAPRSGQLAPLVAIYGLLLVVMAVLARSELARRSRRDDLCRVRPVDRGDRVRAPNQIEESELPIVSTCLVAHLMTSLGVLLRQRDDLAPPGQPVLTRVEIPLPERTEKTAS